MRVSAGSRFVCVEAVSPNAIRTSAAVMNNPIQYAHRMVGSGWDAKYRIRNIGPTMPKTNIMA